MVVVVDPREVTKAQQLLETMEKKLCGEGCGGGRTNYVKVAFYIGGGSNYKPF